MNRENNRNFLEGKKYNIITFGCQMNEHDSETIAGMLEEEGCRQVLTKEESDITIINTCSIRENADKRFFGTLGQLKKIKEKNPSYMACVCGCMMQQQHVIDTIHEKYPWVDIIFGTHNIDRFPELLERAYMEQASVMEVLSDTSHIAEGLPAKRLYQHKSFVNIMYGCNNFCTYCIVPYTRGREKSRAPEDILQEIEILVKDGVREVTLLGQNVNSYKGEDAEGRRWDFSDLIYRINAIDGLQRIRFMTSHPKDLSDKLIQAYVDCDKLCNYIHLPVQSGSSRVLKRMNRRYDRQRYLDLVQRLRCAVPEITISTDIIVGFPGETEEDFEDTLDLVNQVQYDSAFTFLYSVRKGTPAEKFEDQIPEDVIKDRFDRLLTLVQEIGRERSARFTGQTLPVLVEHINEQDSHLVTGRLSNNSTVHLPGTEDMIGKLIPVYLKECKGFYYLGTAVTEQE